MSQEPSQEPSSTPDTDVELVLAARPREVGGFTVGRVLPSAQRRMVGPFIFLDHMGPARLPPGQGMDVRPHPHINLATVTFLFDGELIHRDSLGSQQAIHPGDVNWMTAGRGIVHSERSSEEARRAGPSLHGIQCWVALPKEQEEIAPTFHHHPGDSLPAFNQGAARVRLVAGTAYGSTSPVAVLSPLFFAEATLPAGGTLPLPEEHPERAVYVVEGTIASRGGDHAPGQMAVFRAGARAVVTAQTNARLILLGGAPIEGERHIWWNFVSSSRERLERAALDWKEGRFAKVPGDEEEFIPLPDRPIPPKA
jgi:redox-sensitive bicupin YhaK (pirin superfamily)